MWKFLKIIGGVAKALFWLALALVLAGFLALYLLERDMPAPLVRRLSAALSSDDIHMRIGRATFSLKNGLHLHRVKALPKRVADGALVSADEIAIDVSLLPQTPLAERVRSVTIRNISMPSLPPKNPKRDKTTPDIPDLVPFPIVIENANVLGIKARRLSATVDLSDKKIAATDITVQWPDTAFAMSVAGHVTVDFSKRLVTGLAKGQAFPENLLPLFTALRARGAIRQINCFSKIARPVDAEYTFDVDIDTTDFAMLLNLDVGPCAYRGVPMDFAKGTLGIYGTNIHTSVVIEPLEARSAAGAPLSGRLAYHEETEGLDLNATTTMDLDPLFTIINILNHGELNRIRCAVPPSATVNGAIALSSSKSTITNDLTGKVSLKEGSILNFFVKDLAGDFSLKGYTARFDHVTGTSRNGGKLSGDITFFFPEYAATATVFTTNIQLADVALENLSNAFNVTNARAGLVSGNIRLGGSTHTHTLASLNGEGHVEISDGVINRMKLFAGFTDYLTRTIPGISSIVNQSSGSMDFTVRDGILSTENLLIEGALFSMKGKGTYNLVSDKLDFVVRVNIFRQKTIAGKITHFVTLPFTRLLLEFKVFGSLDNPDWTYVNIIEKITEGFSDKAAPSP